MAWVWFGLVWLGLVWFGLVWLGWVGCGGEWGWRGGVRLALYGLGFGCVGRCGIGWGRVGLGFLWWHRMACGGLGWPGAAWDCMRWCRVGRRIHLESGCEPIVSILDSIEPCSQRLFCSHRSHRGSLAAHLIPCGIRQIPTCIATCLNPCRIRQVPWPVSVRLTG